MSAIFLAQPRTRCWTLNEDDMRGNDHLEFDVDWRLGSAGKRRPCWLKCGDDADLNKCLCARVSCDWWCPDSRVECFGIAGASWLGTEECE